jgi:ATP-dependent Clp protease adaptor protein ClpS
MTHPVCDNDPPPPPEPTPEPQPAPGPAVATRPAPTPAKAPVDQLPPFRVLLHNDDVNSDLGVVQTLVELTPLNKTRAIEVMLEAHTTGVALVLLTHKERAELYQEQFTSKRLTVTIEPAE